MSDITVTLSVHKWIFLVAWPTHLEPNRTNVDMSEAKMVEEKKNALKSGTSPIVDDSLTEQ